MGKLMTLSVGWSGTVETPGKLKGIRVRWEYAPQVKGKNFFGSAAGRIVFVGSSSFDFGRWAELLRRRSMEAYWRHRA